MIAEKNAPELQMWAQDASEYVYELIIFRLKIIVGATSFMVTPIFTKKEAAETASFQIH
jgi:hypothetical protein